MALVRIELKNYNKSGGRTSVGAHARYIADRSIASHAAHNLRQRAGERETDDLMAVGHAHMPVWAKEAPLTYWQAADRHSRANACLGKEVLLTLPRELSPPDNLRLIHQFVQQIPPVPLTWVFHQPMTRDGQHPQPHVHLLLSPWQDDGLPHAPHQYFQRYNAQRPWGADGSAGAARRPRKATHLTRSAPPRGCRGLGP